MTNIKNKLKELSKGKVSKWSQSANFRSENRKWLRYSSNIARRVLAEIEENEDITRVDLAMKLDVSLQYISKVLQGQENLSLKTIANISDALGVELISFPEYKYSVVQSFAPSATSESFRKAVAGGHFPDQIPEKLDALPSASPVETSIQSGSNKSPYDNQLIAA